MVKLLTSKKSIKYNNNKETQQKKESSMDIVILQKFIKIAIINTYNFDSDRFNYERRTQ